MQLNVVSTLRAENNVLQLNPLEVVTKTPFFKRRHSS